MTTQMIRSGNALQLASKKSSLELNAMALSINALQLASGKHFDESNAWIVIGTDGSTKTLKRPAPITQASLQPCTSYHVEAKPAIQAEAASFSSFDALVDSLEADPSSADQLSNGRKWVARAFYSDTSTLTSLRLAAGLSQRQLAKSCDIEQPHVSRYETGKHEPSISVAANMADALGVDLQLFFQAWKNTREQMLKESASAAIGVTQNG